MGKLSFSYISNNAGSNEDILSMTSEFCDNNYDMPTIIVLYRDMLERDDAGLSALTYVTHGEDFVQHNLNMFASLRSWQALEKLAYLDSTEEDKQIDVKKLVNVFHETADILRKQLQEDRTLYIKKTAEQYLSAFYDISKDAVFSEHNANLFNDCFRKSKFLSTLISLAAVKQSRKNYDTTYYEYSLFDPFAYDTIGKTLEGMKLLSRDIYGRDLLSKLRKSIFMDSAQSAFKRYVYLDGQSHRLNLSRHDDSLTAFPVDKLSSTEEIKPIRLFEKTASYIRNGLEEACGNAKEFEVKVCIIGHTEASRCGDECSLMDYVAAVLNWYGKLSSVLDKKLNPTLKFIVTNIISAGDWPGSNQKSSRKNFICKLEEQEHSARCIIETVDYENTFGLNMGRLRKEIDDNDLIFLLDCPWLSTENFEIKQSVSLDMFCRALARHRPASEMDPDAAKSRFVNDSHSFYKDSVFRVLDSQYNRIMASTTTKSGKIVRVMRDYLLRRINKIFDAALDGREGPDQPKRKILYVFTSEKDGIKYSYLASYRLTRNEKYDGRSHTIIRFDNRVPKLLEHFEYKKDTEITFRVNLWSILKYISASYAYLDFKDAVKNCFGIGGEGPEDAICYFELYRNILVCFEVSQNLRHVTVKAAFKKGINSCIKDFLSLPGGDTDAIKEKLLKTVIDLLKPLFTECVFKANKHYGDDAIKVAFSMSLYSCIPNVNIMLFWHKYRTACQSGRFDGFEAVFSDPDSMDIDTGNSEFHDRDFFMDKKLYDSTMQTLEQTASMTLGLRSMFFDANELYHTEDTMRRVLNNIIRACEDAGYTDTGLYKNARQVLREG